MKYDVVIIGGGAAGLFCAIEAGKRGRRTLVIEHNGQVGRKIMISGGGRCNFTNIHTGPENFISANPHFCRSALSRYTPRDFIALVRKHKIDHYEKTLGQLFCRESSRQIVDMLLMECRQAGVRILTSASVERVSKDGHFSIRSTKGMFECSSLVVACGGLSFKKIGATDLGYRIARQFGHEIVETRPSLVALVTKGGASASLAGISLDAEVSIGKVSFRENILFTHRGLSGPAILQISNYWRPEQTVHIDMMPGFDAASELAANCDSKKLLSNFLAERMPRRLAEHIAVSQKADLPMNQLGRQKLGSLGDRINDWQVQFSGTEGYDRAEVTIGGVSTKGLSSSSMGSTLVPGLYFIGEVVDVTGWLGGFNFQWAWSSGFAAGQAV